MELTFFAYATSVNAPEGKFHPAIRSGTKVWFWTNITCGTEQEAYERASLALADAFAAANSISREWNMVQG